MDHLKYSTNLLNYINALSVNKEFSGWIFKGKTDHAFSTPGGQWSENGFLFERSDKKYKFIIRSIPKTEGSYVVLESYNISGQLYNIKLNDKKKFLDSDGFTKLLESFSMTVGKGKKRKQDVENEFKKQGVTTNVISDLIDEKPNWEKVIVDLLQWAVIRENVKKELKKTELNKKTDNSNTIEEKIMRETPNIPLNLILYGPPGTGKTYNTINKSLEILGEDIADKTREEIRNVFDQRVANSQIVFTTFHQSMSYEDFIEGIKPHTKNEKVTYSIQDGIFKTTVKKALIEYIRKDEEIDVPDDFDELYNDFIESVKPLEGKREGIFTTKTGVEMMLVDANTSALQVKYLWSNKSKDKEGQHTFSVTKEKLKKVLLEGIVPNNVKSLMAEVHPLIGHIHCELFAVYKSFYDFVIANRGEIETIHFDYEEMTFADVKEQFDLLSKDEVKLKKVKPYVIIIDEINRGNISQIFGELITLIEEDKRFGNNEALQLTLPYSKLQFGVPPNVFIIGTMNTADRSVEALDTALRRRFSFSEMMPLPNLLSPSAMYCTLLWDNENVGWASKEFQEKENILFELLGVSAELRNQRASIWDKEMKDKTKNDLDHFKHFHFEGINIELILKKINERVEVILDRDHTIGHSYFLKVKTLEDLKSTFKNNIIPLLQEYFYGDYEKIGMILGEGFFKKPKIYSKALFADFPTQNYPENGEILRLKTIDETFDIVGAIKTLMKENK